MEKYDYLIVGSGLFGATFAYKATKAGKKCLVIDKRLHLGGNVVIAKSYRHLKLVVKKKAAVKLINEVYRSS